MTDNHELKGLGGWLILVGIGVVIGPIRLIATLILTYKPVFEDGTWDALTTVGSDVYTPYFGSLLVGEIAFNTIIVAASIFLIYLFFSKHYLFPKLYIGIVVASLVFIPLDAWIVTKMFHGESMFDPDTTKESMRLLITCVVWIPYMLVSKRVRVTFVESMPNTHMSHPLKASADLGVRGKMRNKFLSILGFIAVFIAMAIGGQIGREASKAAFSPSKSSPQDIEAKLIEGFEIALIEINQKCPMMIDEETRLDKATVGPGARGVYHHTFINYKAKDIDADWLRTSLRAEVMQKVCTNDSMKESLQYGGIYVYSYFGNDGTEITRFEIDRNDCGFSGIAP